MVKDMTDQSVNPVPDFWKGANIYFLLTDRFNNGNPENDINFNRTKETAMLRGFMGGDLVGITKKIEEGYFNDLGINAIWFTPVVEQIHGEVDEGTGVTYGFHGYWTKDWTKLDPNFGTNEELHQLVETAHANGIRILMDAVINHTGPVTDVDPVWPDGWVRTNERCGFTTYENTITCQLVDNLPDIKTESNEAVDLPPQLVQKWKAEGRYDEEVAELDAFFERTGYPRAPRFYIMKWLADYITDHGIDGYRVDTVKHTEEYVWSEFREVCDASFEQWKKENPTKVLDDMPFYMVGEVYNYNASAGQAFDFGDKKVNFFANGFNSLINFEFKYDAQKDYETIFSKYDGLLKSKLKDFGVLHYLTSHDDGQPFDADRTKTFEAATKLLLSPGASQVYYGDETARSLIIEGTNGDATLRSFMNWADIENNTETKKLLTHYQKLGQFRRKHIAIGAGNHTMISASPYTFKRELKKDGFEDKVVVGIDYKSAKKTLNVSEVFADGTLLKDHYSGIEVTVKDGKATFNSDFDIVLLEQKE
ncbi:alpha-amylase family glycosyl hydrolase [Spongiivirga sp. MCCC 1A20706]